MNKIYKRLLASQQTGISMIELLISLAISSFLILGITQVYLDNKRNYIFQQSQAGNQESSKFLVMLVDSYLNKAGYRRAPEATKEFAFKSLPASADCEVFKTEASITKAKIGTGICIRYQPLTSQELDCTGQQTPAFDDSKAFSDKNNAVIMVLRYRQDPDATKLNGTLECKVGNQSADLLTGIADFRLQFALDTNSDKTIESIISADNWTSSSGDILQVRYAALMASEQNQRTSTNSSILDTWNRDASNASKSRLAAADKQHLYQLANSAVSMRNLMP
ncbi:MAG: PilW family protein [Pseudomonas sp.]|uniref:PilW family protein n=1 Tax=Pseudomonas sp. TaxID=306 RepID=UPI002732E43E|nr:PilW family protein [Pseudomonas sp.]MDP3846283.1 PilW family protein [Pseudomonas sp.]